MLEVCQSGNLVLACKVLYVKNYYFSKKVLMLNGKCSSMASNGGKKWHRGRSYM